MEFGIWRERVVAASFWSLWGYVLLFREACGVYAHEWIGYLLTLPILAVTGYVLGSWIGDVLFANRREDQR